MCLFPEDFGPVPVCYLGLYTGFLHQVEVVAISKLEFSKIYNPIMKSILRSPLHGLISKSTMLITFSGRKSGRKFTIPVGYIRDDNIIMVFSLRYRTWWRNLRGGAPVTVRIKGQDLKAFGEAVEDREAVASGLMVYLTNPRFAKYFHVTLNLDGQPNPEEVARAAQNTVMTKVKLV